jgi:hypothetical protein
MTPGPLAMAPRSATGASLFPNCAADTARRTTLRPDLARGTTLFTAGGEFAHSARGRVMPMIRGLSSGVVGDAWPRMLHPSASDDRTPPWSGGDGTPPGLSSTVPSHVTPPRELPARSHSVVGTLLPRAASRPARTRRRRPLSARVVDRQTHFFMPSAGFVTPRWLEDSVPRSRDCRSRTECDRPCTLAHGPHLRFPTPARPPVPLPRRPALAPPSPYTRLRPPPH